MVPSLNCFSLPGQLCTIVSVFVTDSSTGREKSEKKFNKKKFLLQFFVSSIRTIDSSPVVFVDLLVDLFLIFVRLYGRCPAS